MNRTQLFNDAWQMMVRNSALWIVALIVLAVGAIVSLVLSSGDLIVVILNALISLVISAFLTGALISMVNAIADGKPQTVNDGLQAGGQKIVPLIALRFLLALPLWIIAFVLSGSLAVALISAARNTDGFGSTSSLLSGGLAGAVGLGVAITLVGIALAAIGVGAERAIVLEDAPVVEAFKRGWNLLTVHLGDFIVIGLLMIVIGLAVGILIGCAVSVVAVPAAISQLGPNGSVTGFGTTVIVTTLLGVVIGVITQVLFSAVWTLAYRQWQGK